jgi:hypothetical protein
VERIVPRILLMGGHDELWMVDGVAATDKGGAAHLS